MSRKIKSESFSIETRYGWMEFKSAEEGAEFKKIICSWEGFTVETAPSSLKEAVEYHLAYTKGGFAEVYAVIRHKEHLKEMYESERRTRYHLASLAPRESIFYKEHFSESYPGYKYGW